MLVQGADVGLQANDVVLERPQPPTKHGSAGGTAPATRSVYTYGAAGLIATAVLWRLFTISQWSWYGDDWAYLTASVETPVTEYLFQNYNGHLMPLQFLVVDVMTSIAPLDYTLAVLVSTALVVASLVTWAVLLKELFGPRKRLLLVLAVLALSPVFLSPSLWFAASLQTFGLQFFMGLVLLLTLRVARAPGRLGPQIMLASAYAAALMWWQKALLITIPVAFVAWLLTDGRGWSRLMRSLRVLGGPALVTVLYLPFYRWRTSVADSANTQLFVPRDVGDSLRFYVEAVLSTALPTLLGGPWTTLGSVQAVFDSNRGAMTLLGLFVGVFATVALLALRRNALSILGMVGLYSAVSWGLVLTSSRYDIVGTMAARDARYAADVVPVLCLAVAFAMTPMVGERGTQWLQRSDLRTLRAFAPALLSVWMVGLVISMAIGNGLGFDALVPNSPKQWVDNIRDSSLQAEGRTLYDTAAPHNVFLPGFNPTEARLSRMLLPLPGERRFNEPAAELLIDDGGGTLRPMEIQAATTSGLPTQPGCGFLVTPGDFTDIAMGSSLFAWEWAVEVRFFTGQPGLMDLRVGSERFRVPVQSGLHKVQVIVNQAVNEVSVGAEEGSAPICVTEVIVGNPVPAAQT